jgi:hypothetical protein
MTYARLSVDDVVTALERHGVVIHRVGGYFSARCPAHDDRIASLTFGDGTDGAAWFKCYAGCSAGEVVRALKTNGTAKPLSEQEKERRRAEADAELERRINRARDIVECALLHPDRERMIREISTALAWDADDLLSRGVGWTGNRVCFPILEDGAVVCADTYAAPGTPERERVSEENPKLRAHGRRGLWGDLENPLVLVEGAPAAATVLGIGIRCAAYPSATGLRRVDAERLRGADGLVVLADADAPGRRAALTSLLVLRDVGIRATALDLFDDQDDGRDVADEIRARGTGAFEWLTGELASYEKEKV